MGIIPHNSITDLLLDISRPILRLKLTSFWNKGSCHIPPLGLNQQLGMQHSYLQEMGVVCKAEVLLLVVPKKSRTCQDPSKETIPVRSTFKSRVTQMTFLSVGTKEMLKGKRAFPSPRVRKHTPAVLIRLRMEGASKVYKAERWKSTCVLV